MEILQGVCASGGVASGSIKVIKENNNKVIKRVIENVAAEIARFNDAVEKTKEQLGKLYEKTAQTLGETVAEIFQIHIMMLEDGSITDCCESIIFEESVNAEYALTQAAAIVCESLLDTKDDYMMARTADVKDIKKGILSALSGEENRLELSENTIIFAHDLTPSQTINLDKSKICAFVTEKGSKNSHAAILARSMKIPSVIRVTGCANEKFNGLECIVDGDTGVVCVSPDDTARQEYKDHEQKNKEREEKLKALKGKVSLTKGGKTIKLYANIGSIEDIDAVIKNDAEGIGLFRSEFLYIGKDKLPDETVQFEAYKEILSKMGGKETIVRTLDIGADKTADCLDLESEENPALGYRAIRICLDNTELFKTQIRALLRASVFGKLSIMFPMIISKEEVFSAINIVDDVKRELKDKNIPFDENVKLGIMIETPASALISEELAPLVDFFSIGTNDLIQYTLACDRQNEKLAKIYDPYHKGVLKLIEMTCKNAHNAGIWVGVCGELAADVSITQTLIDLGADELSVSPPYILPVRESIINSL